MELYNNYHTNVERALSEIDPNWRGYGGLIICGTHTPHDTEFLINKIRGARENKIPALLICFGHQLGAIEHARNVLGIKDATSEEFGQGTFVVKKRDKLKVGFHEGESWWSNYEVVISWEIPNWFVSVAYHPEYQSSAEKPHKDLVRFLQLCRTRNLK